MYRQSDLIHITWLLSTGRRQIYSTCRVCVYFHLVARKLSSWNRSVTWFFQILSIYGKRTIITFRHAKYLLFFDLSSFFDNSHHNFRFFPRVVFNPHWIIVFFLIAIFKRNNNPFRGAPTELVIFSGSINVLRMYIFVNQRADIVILSYISSSKIINSICRKRNDPLEFAVWQWHAYQCAYKTFRQFSFKSN